MRDKIITKLGSFDFHDAEILDVRLVGGDAVMRLKNWQENVFRITFRGVVGFRAFEFSGAELHIRTESSFIDKCIESIEFSKGTAAGYSNYELVQADFGEDGHPVSIVFHRALLIESESQESPIPAKEL